MIGVSLASHAVRAAAQAQGIAILRSGSVKELVEAGTLIELFAPIGRDEANFCYRLVWRENEKSELVRSFVDWAKVALTQSQDSFQLRVKL